MSKITQLTSNSNFLVEQLADDLVQVLGEHRLEAIDLFPDGCSSWKQTPTHQTVGKHVQTELKELLTAAQTLKRQNKEHAECKASLVTLQDELQKEMAKLTETRQKWQLNKLSEPEKSRSRGQLALDGWKKLLALEKKIGRTLEKYADSLEKDFVSMAAQSRVAADAQTPLAERVATELAGVLRLAQKDCDAIGLLQTELEVEREARKSAEEALQAYIDSDAKSEALLAVVDIQRELENHTEELKANLFLNLAQLSSRAASKGVAERVASELDNLLKSAGKERVERIEAEAEQKTMRVECEKKLEEICGGIGNELKKYRANLQSQFPEIASAKDIQDLESPVHDLIERVESELDDVLGLASGQAAEASGAAAEIEVLKAMLTELSGNSTSRQDEDADEDLLSEIERLKATHVGIENVLKDHRANLRKLFPEIASDQDARDLENTDHNLDMVCGQLWTETLIERVEKELRSCLEVAAAEAIEIGSLQAKTEEDEKALLQMQETIQEDKKALLQMQEKIEEGEKIELLSGQQQSLQSRIENTLSKLTDNLDVIELTSREQQGLKSQIAKYLAQLEVDYDTEFSEFFTKRKGDPSVVDRIAAEAKGALPGALLNEAANQTVQTVGQTAGRAEGHETIYDIRYHREAEGQDAHAELATEHTELTTGLGTVLNDFLVNCDRMFPELAAMFAPTDQVLSAEGLADQMCTEFTRMLNSMSDLETAKSMLETQLQTEQSVRAEAEEELSNACVEVESVRQSAAETRAAGRELLEKERDGHEKMAKDHKELQYGISYVLGKHRSELEVVFPELTQHKNQQDESAPGQQMGLVDRVATELRDLLHASMASLSTLEFETRSVHTELGALEALDSQLVRAIEAHKGELVNEFVALIATLESDSVAGATIADRLGSSIVKLLRVVNTERLKNHTLEVHVEQVQLCVHDDYVECSDDMLCVVFSWRRISMTYARS